jgi:T5orf172 domain
MKKSTGIFVPFGSEFKELTDNIENNSANGIAEHLGYQPTQFFSYFDWKNYDENNEIHNVAFEIFTNNIIFVSTKESVCNLTIKLVDNYLRDCDLEYEYRDNAFNIFTDGIEEKSLTVEFLSKVLSINNPKSNGRCLNEKFGYYLFFKEGYLTDFKSVDNLNRWAKSEKAEDPEYFARCKKYAEAFSTDPDEITNELNTQAEARVNIPMNDDFQKNALLHGTSYGTINNYNLLICHHEKKVTLDEFLQINKGRYQEFNSNSTNRRFKVNHFIYEFSGVDLLNTRQINESDEINQGYVYVLINQSLKGMVKIGKTRKMPDDRAKELSSSTGVPTPFFVAYKIFVNDCDHAEKYIHNLLSSKGIRVSNNREFFHIALDEIIKLMIKVESVFPASSVYSEN